MTTRLVTPGLATAVGLALLLLTTVPVRAAGSPDGQKIFDAKCAGCHGEHARGQGSVGKMLHVKSLVEPQWGSEGAVSKIEQVVRDGRKPMPAFGRELSAEQIEAVARYTRGLVHAELGSEG